MAKNKSVKQQGSRSEQSKPETGSGDNLPASEGSDVIDALGFDAPASVNQELEKRKAEDVTPPAADRDEPTPTTTPEPAAGPTLRGPCPTENCTGQLSSSTVQRVRGSRVRVRYLVCHTCGQPAGKETC